MYLNETQISYVGVCLRSVSDTSKGIVDEICEATRDLEPAARIRPINQFFRLDEGRDFADRAIRRVSQQRK